jgi:hypothetical protein
MICDIIERVNIKKVDKCLASDLHIDPAYVVLHPNTERLLCHIWHIKGPKYNNAFYITDMICEMLLHPSRAKGLWSEMIRTLKRGKAKNNG